MAGYIFSTNDPQLYETNTLPLVFSHSPSFVLSSHTISRLYLINTHYYLMLASSTSNIAISKNTQNLSRIFRPTQLTFLFNSWSCFNMNDEVASTSLDRIHLRLLMHTRRWTRWAFIFMHLLCTGFYCSRRKVLFYRRLAYIITWPYSICTSTLQFRKKIYTYIDYIELASCLREELVAVH